MFNFNDIASIAFDEATEKYRDDYEVNEGSYYKVRELLNSLDKKMGWRCDSLSVDVRDTEFGPRIEVELVGNVVFIDCYTCLDLYRVNGEVRVELCDVNGEVKVKTIIMTDGFWSEKESC